MALFGEKYGDRVRVVSVGDWARELCGGTHMRHTGELGVVKLLGESSIGAGVRRVEALVGADAYRFLAREHVLRRSQLAEALKARPEELPERVDALLTRLRDAEREIDKVRADQVLAQAGRARGHPGAGGRRRRARAGRAAAARRGPAGGRADAGARRARRVPRRRARPSSCSVRPTDDGQIALVVAGTTPPRPLPAPVPARSWRTLAGALAGKGGGRDDVAQGAGRGRPPTSPTRWRRCAPRWSA